MRGAGRRCGAARTSSARSRKQGAVLRKRRERCLLQGICAIIEELERAVNDEVPTEGGGAHSKPRDPHSKIVNLSDLLALRERFRLEKKTVVWTNGCFDLLHPGHVRSLQSAKALGDVLVVGVNEDKSVTALKGPARPVQPCSARAEVLAALECVDYVISFHELTPEAIIEKLRPDVHCKGADYASGKKPVPEAELVKSYGGRIAYLPLAEGFSTTELVARLRDGEES